MPQLQKLPIGIQTFAKIREDNYLYVDKTGLIADLVEQGSYYFFSRPRRFGKSLLVSTLQALFEGHETLFQGLALHDTWDWSVRYPVIKISFSGVARTLADMKHDVLDILEENQCCLVQLGVNFVLLFLRRIAVESLKKWYSKA